MNQPPPPRLDTWRLNRCATMASLCWQLSSCWRVFRLLVGFFCCGFPDGKENASKTDFNRVAISNTGASLCNSEMKRSSTKKTHIHAHTERHVHTFAISKSICFNKKNTTHLQRNCHTIYTRNLQIALLVPNQKTHTHLNKINLSHPHSGQITKINSSAFFRSHF